jgi:hypothetical protein
MPLIEMPSGLKGEFRKLKLADQDKLAEAGRTKASKVLRERVMDYMLKDCWIRTLDPGIYAEKMPNPEILDTDELLSGDRMYYLMQVRNESWGSVVSIKATCRCGERIDQGVDLSELEVWPLPEESKQAFVNDEELSVELPLSGRTVRWKLLIGKMEHHAVKSIKQSPKTIASEALALRISRVSGFDDETRLDPETNEDLRGWLRNLDVEDSDFLRDAMMEAEGSIETVIDIPCSDEDCLREIEVDVKEAADFFGRSRGRRRRRR